MRDPDADIRLEAHQVVRTLKQPLSQGCFLRSSLAQVWVNAGKLVAYEEVSEFELRSPRLPFVTYASEWCDAQLHAAAQLTLDLQRESVEGGFDLKDASAWNVIFDGGRPVFCDLLSFTPLKSRNWWALGQFSRQFLLPLVLARYCGLHGNQAFHVWRDGVPTDTAARMLGPKRFLTRYWPLTAGAHRAITMADLEASQYAEEPAFEAIRTFRNSLHATLQWWLAGVAPGNPRERSSRWGRYLDERGHYSAQAVEHKRAYVARWLEALRPAWVADFGCNTGEFSALAVKAGACVVAIDSDHDSLQSAFLTMGESRLFHPVLANLDDLRGGRGWNSQEFQGLAGRLASAVDLVMMLAVVHHLIVAGSIPLAAVADFARRCTRKWLIVEFVGPEDPQLQLLCAQHQRHPDEFTVERQRVAFHQAGLLVQDEIALPGTHRILILYGVSD